MHEVIDEKISPFFYVLWRRKDEGVNYECETGREDVKFLKVLENAKSRSRLKFYFQAVALTLLPILFGLYVQYEARSWWLSAPLRRASYTYYIFGAIFLFVIDVSIIVLVLQLLLKQL
jgi:hypothetical protein